MYYKWKLEKDYTFEYEAEDAEYSYAKVKDNRVTIKAGYAWNGCSPKRSVLDVFVVGITDGIVYFETGKQKLYYPTLEHDCLYQYKIGRRKQADRRFLRRMNKVHFKLAYLYYIFVRIFGVFSWK